MKLKLDCKIPLWMLVVACIGLGILIVKTLVTKISTGGLDMNLTAVAITLIICVTLVILNKYDE